MGLLSEGSPLSWKETKKYADHVRRHGIIQFINQYHKLKDRSNDCLKWGDEMEYMMVHLDHKAKRARLLLKAESVLTVLQEEENRSPNDHPTTWRPEYAAYMLEGTPGRPFGHRMADLNTVEANLKLRREEVWKALSGPGESVLSLTSFPRLGCPDFTMPHTEATPDAGVSQSLFYPDDVIYQGHPRFTNLPRNIRERKGCKVFANTPIFKDKYTKQPFSENFAALGDDGQAQRASKPDHIYMDCHGFGMGCCCLQMTLQASCIDEARILYDQLAPLCPILLALSAASPIYRGHLSDVDCRWDIIASSVDDRTEEERGIKPLDKNRLVIPKSRYDSIDCYLSDCGEKYNDIDLVKDEEAYKQLRAAGIDHSLAQHVAHLFIRDTISLFSEKIHQNDETETDHFENIQSTNWQTMRFKLPPPDSDIGWRVEFRPTEVQLTDFENAAFASFVVLMSRVILSFKLDFLIPISKLDENMKAAQKRDAVNQEKFYFRKDPMSCNAPLTSEPGCGSATSPAESPMDHNEYTLMTINEIVNGKPGEFPGLVPLIRQFLESTDDLDVDTSCTIQQFLRLISERASGKVMTTASWLRHMVMQHPDYKQDSVVSEQINYDLMCLCDRITRGAVFCPKLLIPVDPRTSNNNHKVLH